LPVKSGDRRAALELCPIPPCPLHGPIGSECLGSNLVCSTGCDSPHFCYSIAKHPVHIHDLNATILHTLDIAAVRVRPWGQRAGMPLGASRFRRPGPRQRRGYTQ
jgi:hypothetical protein